VVELLPALRRDARVRGMISDELWTAIDSAMSTVATVTAALLLVGAGVLAGLATHATGEGLELAIGYTALCLIGAGGFAVMAMKWDAEDRERGR
jgi:hypothetical protein